MVISPANRLSNTNEYYFSKKLAEISDLQNKGERVINLGIGNPDLPPSAETIKACVKAVRCSGNHGYQPYRCIKQLREAIAKWYSKLYDVELNPDTEILPLLGSKEGLFYAAMAFLNKRDGVLVPNPGYLAYSSVSNLLEARIYYYNLKEDNGWYPDFDELNNYSGKKIKLMWVNYPNMPTGATGNLLLFRRLIDFCYKNRILLIHDNPYSMVLNSEPLSILAQRGAMDVCIELNSMSKTFNMAGWRVGMALGKKEYIDAILQVKSNVDSGMFLPVQHGVIEAFNNSDAWHFNRNKIYIERRKYVYEIFDLLDFSYNMNQAGLFVWAKANHAVIDVEKFLDEILYKAKIFITPGFIFGANGVRYARISLCSPVEVFKEALKRLNSVKVLKC
ncbi:MAG: aminotransferase class I/II-fold pyridoxal phosphate-dependent enzyme [Bacteroidia bacterium]|nr:aminotransferase class I/II-fold pyridoxal phosphate-dependent enzyme [Bacteroidia bacterium]